MLELYITYQISASFFFFKFLFYFCKEGTSIQVVKFQRGQLVSNCIKTSGKPVIHFDALSGCIISRAIVQRVMVNEGGIPYTIQ
jgi:hypothetical protein